MTTDTNNIIRQIRTRAGLTQRQLADAIGRSYTTITDMEAERYGPPSLAKIVECADAVGISVAYMAGGWRILPDDFELPPEA